MSTEEFSGAALCKKRFKGIENFLKRVAFNLGNTQSQTEVKIISCIPIDVTDLQQKIIHLEKQLEDATCAVAQSSPSECQEKCGKSSKATKFVKLNKSGKQSVNTAIIESNFPTFTSEAISCKSLDCDRCTSPACLDNKGKSNGSFALAALDTNTAPVILSEDNSEIFRGADQAVKPNKMDHYYTQEVQPNNLDQHYSQEFQPNNLDQHYRQKNQPNYFNQHYIQSMNLNNRDHYYSQEVSPINRDHYYTQEIKPNNMDHYCNQAVRPNNFEHYYNAPKMCEPKTNNLRQTLFKKKKKILKNKKGTSPCVYYAQTYSSPFIKSNLSEDAPKYERNEVMTRSYLGAMVSRQYKPEVLGDNISLHSQFSSPICRDVQQHNEGTYPCESDICSCCHGPFHNIDKHVNKQNTLQTYMLHQMNQGSAFYDTDQYDLVPVKEKPVKITKYLERPRKKELRPHIDMKCWPENVRTKCRYHSLYPTPTTNYFTARPRADYIIRDKLDSYGRKMPVTYSRTEPITRILAKRRKEIHRRDRSINIETSKSCSIDFGSVYPKITCKKPKKLETLQPIPVPKKNAECLTTVINNSECQTEMSTIEVNSADTKTEATLNQIKSILQSVLAEVKVSSQTKGLVIQNKPKKDAVVQKGPSCSNMQASTFMNSITYSPYAMNPPYATSRQLSANQYCCPHGGMKCFHNFPVFIQNPGGRQRHVCSSCYRSAQVAPGSMKQGTTAATNTGQERSSFKETEKLIKEIYKSMALTMDVPNKDTSLSEYDETVKSLHGFTTPIILKTEPKKQPKIIRNVVQAVSELFMKKDMIETSDTFNSTVESKLPSHELSMRSHAVTSTDTEFRMRMDRPEKYLRAKNKQPVVPEVEEKTFREAMVQNANSITESETSSSECDTSTTVVGPVQNDVPELKHLQKKGKEGLFTKMFKSVKLFKTKEKPNKRVEKTESEEETSSDSDDYQTVYSQKIQKNLRHRSRPHNLPKRKTHSKISYNKSYQRDRSPEKKRSPYMEQEYRRYWDEKLMFHNNRPRYSSERQTSERLTPQKPAYYRTYEARTALVQPNTQVPKNGRSISRKNDKEKKFNVKSAGIAWLKKHKKGIHCGEQWKKFVLES